MTPIQTGSWVYCPFFLSFFLPSVSLCIYSIHMVPYSQRFLYTVGREINKYMYINIFTAWGYAFPLTQCPFWKGDSMFCLVLCLLCPAVPFFFCLRVCASFRERGDVVSVCPLAAFPEKTCLFRRGPLISSPPADRCVFIISLSL